jgi:hypothetical protein
MARRSSILALRASAQRTRSTRYPLPEASPTQPYLLAPAIRTATPPTTSPTAIGSSIRAPTETTSRSSAPSAFHFHFFLTFFEHRYHQQQYTGRRPSLLARRETNRVCGHRRRRQRLRLRDLHDIHRRRPARPMHLQRYRRPQSFLAAPSVTY